jgi:hypothetical protein
MRAAQFLARYPNADPFNRTNSDHPESTLPLALSRGVFLRCNIAADLTLNCSLRVELEPEVAYFPAFTAPLKQESTKVVCFFNSVVPVPDTSGKSMVRDGVDRKRTQKCETHGSRGRHIKPRTCMIR